MQFQQMKLQPNIRCQVRCYRVRVDVGRAIKLKCQSNKHFLYPVKNPILSAAQLRELEGEYRFSDIVSVTITTDGDKLYAQATGEKPAYNIAKNAKTELLPVSKSEFMALGRTPHTIQF